MKFPFAVGDRGIDGDLVAQTEVTGGKYGIQEFADLLGGGDFVGDRHSFVHHGDTEITEEKQE